MLEMTIFQRRTVDQIGNAIASIKRIGLRTDYSIEPWGWESSVGWIRSVGQRKRDTIVDADGILHDAEIRTHLVGDERYREAREARAYGKLKAALETAEKYGLTMLGSGYFGIAFLNELTGKVIKITASDSNDGWIDYIQWAIKNYDKHPLHLPKIYEFEYGEIYTYAVMDCMEDSLKGELNNDYRPPLDITREGFIDNIGNNIEAARPEFLVNKVPDTFMECLDDLWAAFEVGDCHSGNLMIFNGNLVITDPIAWID